LSPVFTNEYTMPAASLVAREYRFVRGSQLAAVVLAFLLHARKAPAGNG